MSSAAAAAAPAKPAMSFFERYLSLWVALCIAVGLGLGHLLPNFFRLIASAELARVNLPVAVLIWLMIIPMLLKIDFGALGSVRQHWKGVGVTLFINWAVKPFSMAALGTLFIGWLFAPLLPAEEIPSYIAGLIILAAPCTAMVFVWSNLCEGEPNYTLSQVALNDIIMVFAFAPVVGLLLGVAAITVPWDTLLLSVVLYIVIPVIIAQLLRRAMLFSGGQPALDRLLKTLGPVSLVSLLTTLVLLFGFQGEQILTQPLVIALLAVPILIQVYFNAGLAYWLSRRFGVAWCVAAPAALIGASNFFELAVAAAISLFGINSGAALATVVGVLVEVPVMLSVVSIVKKNAAVVRTGCHGMRLRTLSDPDYLPGLDPSYVIHRPALGLRADGSPPRFLLLYGSLRERSYSRLCVEEAARLLQFLGQYGRHAADAGPHACRNAGLRRIAVVQQRQHASRPRALDANVHDSGPVECRQGVQRVRRGRTDEALQLLRSHRGRDGRARPLHDPAPAARRPTRQPLFGAKGG